MENTSLLRKRYLRFIYYAFFGVVATGIIIYWFKQTDRPSTITFPFPSNTTTQQTIEVPLRISVENPMNAAEFYFSFPKDKLAVQEIRQTGSIFKLWIKDSPSFSNDNGTIYIAGGLPKPGFSGENGLIATVVFKTLTKGTGDIVLDETKSRILANDGKGTAIPSRWQPVHFGIR